MCSRSRGRRWDGYISTLSSRGQGPEEYLISIYDSYIDEVGSCVYLLPMMSKNILTYDLQGNAQKSIPLAFNVGKGRFRVNTQGKHVDIFTLPFDSNIPVHSDKSADFSITNRF